MTGDERRLQPGVTLEMRDRLVRANADAKQYAAEIGRLRGIPLPSLSPEQVAAIHAQAFSAEPEAEP